MENFFNNRFQNYRHQTDERLWQAVRGNLSPNPRKRRVVPIVLLFLALLSSQKITQVNQEQKVVSLPYFSRHSLSMDLKPTQVTDFKIVEQKIKTGGLTKESLSVSKQNLTNQHNVLQLPSDVEYSDTISASIEKSYVFVDIQSKSLINNILDTFHVEKYKLQLEPLTYSKPKYAWDVGLTFSSNLSYFNLKLDNPNYEWRQTATNRFHDRLGLTVGVFAQKKIHKNFHVGIVGQFSVLRGGFEYVDFEKPTNFNFDYQSNSLTFNPHHTKQQLHLQTYSIGLLAQYTFKNKISFTFSPQYRASPSNIHSWGYELVISKPVFQVSHIKVDLFTSLTRLRTEYKVENSPISALPYYFGLGIRLRRP